MNWGGWRRGALVVFGVLIVLVVFAVLYGRLPWWIDGPRLRKLSPKDQLSALGSDRGDVLKMVAGAGALVALVYTARKHALERKAHALSEQGQVTDRYTKAITQLASDKLSERVGGIYALERIMADSVRDHPTVVEVLAAFVRQRVPLSSATEPAGQAGQGEGKSVTAVRERQDADVQAAMTVLARRPYRNERYALDLRRTALAGLELPPGARFGQANLVGADLTKAILSEADLSSADLRGATLVEADLTWARLRAADFRGATLVKTELAWARLEGADFEGAMLTKADLRYADLTKADFTDAMLAEADFEMAILTRADLTNATLTGADLEEATLTEADLDGATLTGANLKGATLIGAKPLEVLQLEDAVLDDSTKLDDSLASDPGVRARIRACDGWERGDPVPRRTPGPPRTAH